MIEQLNLSIQLIISQTRQHLKILEIILAIPWGLFFLSCFNNRLLSLGIYPRSAQGILGIFLAPFLHVNFNHIFFNSIPLVVLSNFLLMNGLYYFLTVTLLITMCSGLLIWCFAKPGIHIGASALITGYWGLLITNSLQQNNMTSYILGALSFYYFSGILLGIFPSKKGISWEGHFFGLLSGVFLPHILKLTIA
ncbi:MAG: rhomboid family intramembrane serine protease [Legionella sp.]